MKRWLLRLTAAGLLLAVVGFLVAASGIIPIKASSGHWAVTKWLLRFGMNRSVATHTLGVKTPPLDDPGLVLKGAGHYEVGCRSCHGEPGHMQPRIAARMTPTPPYLAERIRESNSRKLFYVVKHGIKFTGMPAWPSAQRDDEVWAMVAFLQKLPELDADGYRRLVDVGPPPASAALETFGPTATPASRVIQSCARCHGHDGAGRGNAWVPKLAGQRPEYLRNALEAYARGRRHSGIMEPVAAGLDTEMMAQLSTHYAALRAPASSSTAGDENAAVVRGRAIAWDGIPSQRVPACIECHGAEGRRRKPAYPFLDGQPADYLQLQLELIKAGHRGGSAYAHLMEPVATRLEPEQMRDVARYFESLPTPQDEPGGRKTP